jgi:cell division protein FtsL
VSLGEALDSAEDRLSLGVTEAQIGVADATSRARVVMLLALVSLTAMMVVATFLVSRLISGAFQSTETERDALKEASATLQYRNDQLNALYAVFSEITDTLSMRYVISATLRETLRVMNGTNVVLRLLQGSDLVVVGNLTDEGKEISNLPPVPLGEGPTGRVARRGRSMRIEHGAQGLAGQSPVPDAPDDGVESGIIVPLIVGVSAGVSDGRGLAIEPGRRRVGERLPQDSLDDAAISKVVAIVRAHLIVLHGDQTVHKVPRTAQAIDFSHVAVGIVGISPLSECRMSNGC